MDVFKAVVVLALLAIVASLASALFHLVRETGDSRKMVRALTVRISLSVALFVLMMIGWKLGWVTPHGLGR
ncbi:MAG: twin transmembrane helix small protein [Steroidobacteraceae bacterium]|nr:twin transmembrane helix small protein [Steroidobacteraceae bacterium]MDW8259961.1 twin transmembrane helix small protein [Gammaproteobacteria bacterium]